MSAEVCACAHAAAPPQRLREAGVQRASAVSVSGRFMTQRRGAPTESWQAVRAGAVGVRGLHERQAHSLARGGYSGARARPRRRGEASACEVAVVGRNA